MTNRLPDLIAAGDMHAVDEFLRCLAPDERSEARAWFDSSRRWFRTETERSYEPGGGRMDQAGTLHWMEGLCAVRLCGPATAAKRVPWGGFWDYQELAGEAAFVQVLRDADAEWASSFVTAAAEVSLGSDESHATAVLARVLRAVVQHHGLPCPSGATFLNRWLGMSWPEPLPRLRSDELMPDILYHFLASGHAGQATALPPLMPTLLAEGRVDRARVLDTALEALTAQQKVSSQRVLAGILRSLELKAAEAPGGIAYLTGVLATSDGSVGLLLLPLALELVSSGEELRELATVVAGRPERKQKELLLRSLVGDRLRGLIDEAALTEALQLLAETDDAGLRTKVGSALASLGAAPAGAAPNTGLWQATPQPGPVANGDWWWRDRASNELSCRRPLSNDPHHGGGHGLGVLPWGVRQILLGRLTVDRVVAETRTLLATGELALPMTAQLFEQLFLAGGMSLTWSAALEVADAACGMRPRPRGLVGLLRMLATYAPEAPRQEVPAEIARFAAEAGNSKAHQEAQALGAILVGCSVVEFQKRLKASPTVLETAQHQGLCLSATGDSGPVPARLNLGRLPLLDRLVTRASADRQVDYAWVSGESAPDGFTASALVLHDLLMAVRHHGEDAVRTATRQIDQPVGWAGPVRLAVRLWATGLLTLPAYWRLAAAAGIGRDADSRMGQVWDDLAGRAGLTRPENSERNGHARIEGSGAQFLLLLACESLLLAGSVPSPLSTPAYEDGSLDFDDLIGRLRERRDGHVGPLDLIQALYRLRPTDRVRAKELAGLIRSTKGELTSPEGVALDAADAVRAWVEQGGLPDLVAVSSDGRWPRWAFDAERRLSMPWLDAAYDGFVAMAQHSGYATRAMVSPLWPDLLLANPYAELERPATDYLHCLASRSGKLGLPAHDYLLASMCQPSATGRAAAVPVLIRLAEQGRLNPDAAAQAALGRWAAGTMSLARSVPAWEQVLLGGGLRGAWHSLLAIADAGCSRQSRPAGLPSLLHLLADYGHEAPDPVTPPLIGQLAAEKGSSRAHVEARALVAALTRSGRQS